MVYGIVQRHHGEMAIESRLGRGTTFQFTFPIDTSGEQLVDAPAAEAAQPLRILVVDDQPVLCEVLAESLTRDWHTVSVASNGREALEVFEAGEFDLVITDKAMPEMNGDQLAAAVKVRRPEVKVVMLTGFGEFEAGEEIESEFIDFLLPKPATMVEIRNAIVRVIGPAPVALGA
jgi:DNA-binding NtrC family response regulator